MSGLFEAYLSGSARTFLDGHYADPDDRRRAVRRAARPLAPAIAAALDVQNARLVPSAARDAHLTALRRGAAAVVTGQQVGLLLGPLYTVYKAASAVGVARALAAETRQPVVPVFWLQTEDHDLAEIAECHVPRARGGALTLRPLVPAAESLEPVSVAQRTLPESITASLEQLAAELARLPYATPHLERLSRHYRAGAHWGEAFAGLLAELFVEEGLVLIDPRDPALAKAATPVHRRALTEARSIATALAARGRALVTAGFAVPVHLRPGAPLSFFHPHGPAGPRYRLVPAAQGFEEVGGGGVHTLDALLATLDAEPLQFSTSALLRPILQDTWLPTAACVGGPTEVAYFAQLAPLYAAYELPPPLVVPRARFRILEEKTMRLLARLRLTADDAARTEDELLAVASRPPAGLDRATLARHLLAPFDAALEQVRGQMEGVGPGLATAAEKTRATVARAVVKLADKYETARLHHDRALVDAVRRVQWLLHPHGMPQERFYGLSYFAARYGERRFIDGVLAGVRPFDPTPRDLCWSSEDTPAPAVGSGERRR